MTGRGGETSSTFHYFTVSQFYSSRKISIFFRYCQRASIFTTAPGNGFSLFLRHFHVFVFVFLRRPSGGNGSGGGRKRIPDTSRSITCNPPETYENRPGHGVRESNVPRDRTAFTNTSRAGETHGLTVSPTRSRIVTTSAGANTINGTRLKTKIIIIIFNGQNVNMGMM